MESRSSRRAAANDDETLNSKESTTATHTISDEDSDKESETQPYSLDGGSIRNDDSDFHTAEEGESSDDGRITTGARSTAAARSKKPTDVKGKTKGKYNLRQTTLPFGKAKAKKPQEDDEDDSKAQSRPWKFRKMKYSDADTMEYRQGYPDKEDNLDQNENLKFYMGEIESTPDGDYIDIIHEDWFGKYNWLERHHGYIQWLFPIQEMGMNWESQALQRHEAEAIQNNPAAKLRVLTSYKLMLDFYGMELADEVTGRIQRARNWKTRFDHLNWSTHNYLRITRILKSLGELGYEHLKKPFLEFVLDEGYGKKTLARTMGSCKNYWIGTVKSDEDRKKLHESREDLKHAS